MVVPVRSDALFSQLSAMAQYLCAEKEIPGISLAVSTPHCAVEAAAGHRSLESNEPLSVDTHFRIGCVAKLLLSIVALEQAQNGRVDLNAPVGGVLSELAGSVHGRDISMVHLLSHTTGCRAFPLTDPSNLGLTWGNFVHQFAESSRRFPPGSVFSYEHANAVLAAEVIQRATAEKLPDLVWKLCSELGLSPGTITKDGVAREQAGGPTLDVVSGKFASRRRADNAAGVSFPFWQPAFSNLTMSMSDVARVGHALCGFVDSATLQNPALSAATRGILQKPVVHLPVFIAAAKSLAEPPRAFGLGTEHYADGWYGVTTSFAGQCVAVRYHPGRQISVAAGINCRRRNLLLHLMRSVCSMASGEVGIVTMSETVPAAIAPPADLEGMYCDGGGNTCEVRVGDGYVSCAFDGFSFKSKFLVNINMSATPPVLDSSLPGAIMSFFKTAGPNSIRGLMFGMNAYRRDCT